MDPDSGCIVLIPRYLVYCTDLVALTEAKEIMEGEVYKNMLGLDDGKDLIKVEYPDTFRTPNFKFHED